MSAHCVVDGGDVVHDTTVVSLHTVNQERIVFDLSCLFFTDEITNDIHEPLRLTFSNELGSVDALSQKSHVSNLKLALPHIETLLVLVVKDGLQIVDLFFIAGLFCLLKHHVHFIQVNVLLEHEHNSVDVLDVTIDGAAFRRNAAALQIADDVVSGFSVVFVGVFHQVLQHHIGLQLLVGLLAMLGNDLAFQTFVGFSGHFLVDDFISHLRELLFESSFSNSITHRK